MELVKQVSWEKIAVCFIYLCAQFLVLASLLLTTTSLAPHIIFILLSIVFFFVTSFKEVFLILFSLDFMWELWSPTMKMQN